VRLLETDATFAAAVRDWEERLTPLAAGVPPVAPSPEVWERIAATTAPPVVVPFASRRRLRVWQTSTGAALALAASLAAFAVLRSPPLPRVAVLAPTTGGVPVLLATAEPNGVLRIRPDGTIVVPSDHDLELWALGAGETRPRSLGVLPASGVRMVTALPQGTQLLVSLEPRGGSPTGQPTGPVLYGGRLADLE
jgi:anti-sigma-K factor RskA